MLDRYHGALLGLALGDALGAPLEGLKAGHIAQLAGEVDGFLDPVELFPERPGKWRLKGLYTDDTQQALCLAEVLAVQGEPDPAALADLYRRLADEGPPGAPFGAHRGSGHGFRRAVAALAEHEDPRRAGQPSAGLGAAMRIAPVGLYYREDPEALARATVELSLLTHNDVRGLAGALALARGVALCLEGREPGALMDELLPWLREWEERLFEDYGPWLDPEGGRFRMHQFSRCLEALPSLLREQNDTLAEKTLLELANQAEPQGRIAQLQAAFAPVAVPAAFYRALSARDFAGGLRAALNGGGDTDSVGAMTGALLGARFGEGAIPDEWIAGLRHADQIRLRARALLEKEPDWTAWEDLVEMEKAATQDEMETLADAARAHEKDIARARRKAEARRDRRPARQRDDEDLPFAPPPEAWLGRDRPVRREEMDPVEAKKERARRGRRRIEWKEERRRKHRDEG